MEMNLSTKELSPVRTNVINLANLPGGPYRRQPFGGVIPTLRNNSGLRRGSSITSRSSRICSAKPDRGKVGLERKRVNPEVRQMDLPDIQYINKYTNDKMT